jgi:hypothetical protein
MHKSDIIDPKSIIIRSFQSALLAIEPTSLYYSISKDSNHVEVNTAILTAIQPRSLLRISTTFYWHCFQNKLNSSDIK